MPHYAVRASSTCVSENNEGLRSTNLRIEIGSRKRAELRRKLGLTAGGVIAIRSAGFVFGHHRRSTGGHVPDWLAVQKGLPTPTGPNAGAVCQLLTERQSR